MADSLLLEALAIVHNPWRASAYLNGAQSCVMNDLVNLDTIVYDPNGNFNTGTHWYTAAVNGIYTVSWRLSSSNSAIDIVGGIWVNGAERLRGSEAIGKAGAYVGSTGAGVLVLNAGDTVGLYNSYSSGVSAALVTNAVNTYMNIM